MGVFNHKERRTKRRHLFLFNDLLLITKKEGKKSFWLKILIALTPNLRVEDVPDSATLYKGTLLSSLSEGSLIALQWSSAFTR